MVTVRTPNYLPNLDALRAVAALSVLIHHCDNIFVDHGLKKSYTVFPFGFGSLAVVLFFVLSGFLITYLLLREKEATGTISIKRFYTKRVLRIWPLYYVLVIASLVYFNHHPFWAWPNLTDKIELYKNPALYAFLFLVISPNVIMTEAIYLGYAGPTWSIGIEEQFYLLWPWLIRKKNALFYVVAAILVVYLLSQGFIATISVSLERVGIVKNPSRLHHLLYLTDRFFTFQFRCRIDCMAIGALGAFAVVKYREVLPQLYSLRFQLLVYTLMALLMIFPHAADDRLYALLFMFIIVNLATNPKTVVRLENPVLNYLGRISYGIYIYHMVAIAPAFYLATTILHFGSRMAAVSATILFTFLLTVGIASLSHYYFERFFLRLKPRSKLHRLPFTSNMSKNYNRI